jgi:hypothetical protein
MFVTGRILNVLFRFSLFHFCILCYHHVVSFVDPTHSPTGPPTNPAGTNIVMLLYHHYYECRHKHIYEWILSKPVC